MDPVTSSQVFEQDPEMNVTEQPDGSAIIDIPEEPAAPPVTFSANLAETLDQFTLNTIATDLDELLTKDKEARKRRDEQYEEGIKRTGLGDEAPGGATFSGASKVVHPVLAEGCVDFAARAIKELFPPAGPVKTKIFGEANEQRLAKAKAKRDYLNWFLVERLSNYRDEKEILLTQLPLGGSQYEKYWYDPGKRRIEMEFVPIDKVLLPYAATSFYSAARSTHIQEITQATFERRVASKLYRKIGGVVTESVPDTSSSEAATNTIEGKEESSYNEDGLRTIYEISCELDLDGDDKLKPYVVHLDDATTNILAIYRNWDENDPNTTRLDWWVENKFIPWRGAYGIGLPHLIGGMSGALTGALRALLDSAHINNSPGAVKLKSGRTNGQNLEVAQTEVKEIEAPAGVDDIRKLLMPMPFNPPSAVLFQLLDWLTAQAKGVVATAEEKIADATNNMPVGTTLALIEQGSQVFSSIHARLHASQHRALKIICRLIAKYPDAESLQRFGLTPEDFTDMTGIEPVSDPLIFSEAQRYAQLQEEIKVVTTFPQLPWNFIELARRALELLRVDGVDSLLPKPPEPISSDPVSENVAATMGTPLKPQPAQDHLAHVKAHLEYLVCPIHQLQAGPMPQLAQILAHASQHLTMFYQMTSQAAMVSVMQQSLTSGEEASQDQIAMRASKLALDHMGQLLSDVVPMFQQASQVVQAKTPPPQMPPEVQATMQAAMAEINRKAQESAARLQFDQQKHAGELQKQQQQAQIDQHLEMLREENRKQLAVIQETGARQVEEMRARVEMMKNEQDNHQHQMTELLKNRDDNNTAVIIEQMKQALAAAQPQQPAEPPQNDAMLKEMQRMLGELQKAKTDDALSAVVQGLHTMIGGQQAHQERMMNLAGSLLQGGDA